MDRLVIHVGTHAGWPQRGSSSTQVGPAMGHNKLLQSWEVFRISIDVTDQEGRAMPTKSVVTGYRLDDSIGGSSFGSVAMEPTVPINIIPMAQPPSFALAMGDKLSPPQVDEGGKALTARFQWQARVRSKGNHTNTCTRLTTVGVRPNEVELASMFGAKLVGQASHGGT